MAAAAAAGYPVEVVPGPSAPAAALAISGLPAVPHYFAGFLVAGYHSPTTGQVRLGGRPVRGPAPERLMVFQETALMPWLTVADNVAFGLDAIDARLEPSRSTDDDVDQRSAKASAEP